MFKSFLSSPKQDVDTPLTPAELEAFLDDERQVALLESELNALDLLSTALKAGGSPTELIAAADADGSLTTLLGCEPVTLALEELQDKVEEASTEGKKVFWTKKKKVLLAALAATAVAIGSAALAVRRLKSNLPATLPATPSPATHHAAPPPTPPKAATPNLPAPKGARVDHDPLLNPEKVGYGQSNPSAHAGAQDKVAEKSRMRETLLPYLRNLAKDVHEQAYKSQSALTHIRTADAADKKDYGSKEMEELMKSPGYVGFEKSLKGGGFGNRTSSMVDKEENVHTLLNWIDEDLGYIQKNSRAIPETLKEVPPSVIGRMAPAVKAYLPSLKTFSESLGSKISTLDDIEAKVKQTDLK